MILIFKDKSRLCEDGCWREHASFGTYKECAKIYKSLSAAKKRAQRIGGHVAVVPAGFAVSASGDVMEYVSTEGYERVVHHILAEYVVDDFKAKEFIDIAPISVSYKLYEKDLFHVLAARVLKALAVRLGYKNEDFDLRHNQGGIAVSGEITLHSDTLYIQFSQSACGINDRFMWRTCKGRKDYTGGTNQWMKWADLKDLNKVATTMLLMAQSVAA